MCTESHVSLRGISSLNLTKNLAEDYLGTSSNWAFARRVLTFAHQHVTGEPLPSTGLLFEGSSYDLGWDGRRSAVPEDVLPLPTADFALYLINTVKFHCGQLFHLFDEESFMRHFANFHGECGGQANAPVLWYVHYLVILAFGKSFVVRKCYGRRPAGADFFIQAMKLLPDVTFLYTDPLHSIEILCCIALYLQCLDLRSSAYVRVCYESPTSPFFMIIVANRWIDWTSNADGYGARPSFWSGKQSCCRSFDSEMPGSLVDSVHTGSTNVCSLGRPNGAL